MAGFLWTERANFGPAARQGAAMAYDSSRRVTVMFGGNPLTSSFLGDTWEWDGREWAQVSDMGPMARTDARMVFAADQNACVLFGGVLATAGQAPSGDTWLWDGTAWTQILDSGPTARAAHGMAFDSNRNRVVLFGGLDVNGQLSGDTWEFDGTAWTEQQVTGPSARRLLSMAFDDAGKRVVVFGGFDGQAHGDTWTWDGQRWVQIAEFGPAARYNAAMSGGQGSLVLMGGDSPASTTSFLDTWQLSGNSWKQLENVGPGPLSHAASVLDSARKVIVLFGGLQAGKTLGNTWEGPLPLPPLAVLSAVLQLEGNLLVTSITLNDPAPAGGILVNVSLTKDGQIVPGSPTQLSAAAGQTAVGTFESSLPAGTYILTAQIPGTPVVSGSITI